MKRWLLLLLILALLTAGASVLLLTSTGLKWVAGVAAPAGVAYEQLDGRLIGPLSVTGLRWQTDTRQLKIDKVALDWKPGSLFARHVNIRSLHLAGVHWQDTGEDTTRAEPGEPGLPRLPVRITVGDLRIENTRIEQGETMLTADLLRLSAELESDVYRINGLELRSPAIDLSGAAAVGLESPFDVEADLSWEARIGAEPVQITGSLNARGDSDTLQLQATTQGDVVAQLNGTAARLLSDPGFDGSLQVSRVDPRLSQLADDRLMLSFEIGLSPERLQLEGQAQAPSLSPRQLSLIGTVSLDGQRITIEDLEAELVGTPLKLTAAGSAQRDLSALDLSMAWQQLAWPLSGPPTVASPAGRATLSGNIDAYALDLTATASADGWPQMHVALRGNGDRERFEIAEASVRPDTTGPAGERAAESLLARGTIGWQTLPVADLDIVARNLRLERLHPQLAGTLSTDGRARIRVPESGPEIAIDVRKIDGRLRDQPVRGSGGVDVLPDRIAMRSLKVMVGDARLEASGTIGSALDLQWEIQVPELALLLPDYAGAIGSAGRAGGPRNRPAVFGNVEVRELSGPALAIERLNGNFDVGLDSSSRAEIRIDGTGVIIAGTDVGKVHVESQGTIASQAITLEADGPAVTLRAQLAGGLEGNSWRGEVTAMSVGREELGDWQLSEAATLEVETQLLNVGKSCFAQRDSSVCIQGALARGVPARTDFAISALPIAAFARLLPPGLQYEGTIDGDGFVALDGASLGGTASLALSPGRVITREDDDETILFGYEAGRLKADIDDNLLAAEVRFDLPDDGIVEASVRTPVQGSDTLDGKVRVELENLNLIPTYIPQIGRIDGRIEAYLDVAGTRSAPQTNGEVRLDARELVLPDFGITLRQSRLDFATVANEVTFSGQASSGDGNLELEGMLRWYDGTPVGRLRLNGTNFRAVDLPELRIDASPKLTVSVADREIAVAGEVGVPSASISPLNISRGVAVSPDQIIVDEEVATPSDERWQVDATLQVNAGDDVAISGFGLKGRLTGGVLIVQPPGQPATGRGALEVVDGRYRAYGQDLAINTGRLEFTGGPIDNPGLDLRASRQAGEIEAGVQVRGALRRPVLTLYAIPPQSDTQTLSYLVTGRGIEDLDEAGQTAVGDAATRLALQQSGSLLANSVGRGLGLDTVAFEDEGTTASTALVVGKQLSPRLFVSYGIGLFDAINRLRLRYQINSNLMLETESGVNSSADLLYTFDR